MTRIKCKCINIANFFKQYKYNVYDLTVKKIYLKVKQNFNINILSFYNFKKLLCSFPKFLIIYLLTTNHNMTKGNNPF